jgi:hypothetical protein
LLYGRACRDRVLIRARRRALVYRRRGPIPTIVLLLLAAAALVVGGTTGHLLVGGIGAAVVVAAGLAAVLRITRPVPAGPRGDGPAPPGGAGVREPRRPLPVAPSGVAERRRYEGDEPPFRAVAG